MRTLTLHRGIAVPQGEAERVVEEIRASGMSGSEGTWRFRIPDIADVRRRLDVLFTKSDLTRNDIFTATPFNGLCACGVPTGAAYHPCRRNSAANGNYHPIMIEFTADVVDICVDARDFLCAAFQLWDRKSEVHRTSQSEVLRDLFGTAITRYFAASCRSSDPTYRIGMCNLAAFDSEVVEAHFANTKVIGGRYGTRFSSAFFVKAPVCASRIKRVYTPSSAADAAIDISLRDFIEGAGA
jgi:hypothetical protein